MWKSPEEIQEIKEDLTLFVTLSLAEPLESVQRKKNKLKAK